MCSLSLSQEGQLSVKPVSHGWEHGSWTRLDTRFPYRILGYKWVDWYEYFGFNCSWAVKQSYTNRVQTVTDIAWPCIYVLYSHILVLHSNLYSYLPIRRHDWSPILVPVNPCITECTVWESCVQPCSVWDRLKWPLWKWMVPQSFNLRLHLLISIVHVIRFITNRKYAFYCIH